MPSSTVEPTPTVEPMPEAPAETLGLVTPAGGKLRASDGRIEIEFPGQAVGKSVEVKYRIRSKLPQRALRAQGMAIRFDLDALASDDLKQPVFKFAQPLTLTLSITGLIDLDNLPQGLRPYLAYQTPEGNWVEVPILVDRKAGTLTAQIDHFSSWGSGVAPGTPGVWSFAYNPPQTSLFSGAATYQIAFQVPPGRNGLQPQLALSYNSRRIDGRTSQGWWASYDAGPVTDGWSLDVMDITRERWVWCDWDHGKSNGPCFQNYFVLSVNGTVYELYEATAGQAYGRYYAKDAPQLYVERRNDCSDDGNCSNGGGAPNNTGEYWIVRLPDGTEARLGYNIGSEQVTGGVCPQGDGCKLGRWYFHQGYGGHTPGSAVRRWRVDKMTDTSNNIMTFTYEEALDGATDSRSTVRHIYYNYTDPQIPSSYLTEIALSGASGASPTIDMIAITNTNNSGVRQQVRQYILGRTPLHYGVPGRCNGGTPEDVYIYELTSVQEKNGSMSLPAQSFSYNWFGAEADGQCYPMPRVTLVNNGYGGTTALTYQWDGDGQDGRGRNYRVQQVSSSSGVAGSPAIVSTYTYGTACYDQWTSTTTTSPCASRQTGINGPDAPKGPLVGHDWVTEQRLDESSVAAQSTHWFNITDPALIGRESQVQRKDGAGALLQQTNTTWTYTSIVTATTFAHADQVVATDYGGATASKRTDYVYDAYGNVVAEYDHGAVDPVTREDTAPYQGDERSKHLDYYYTATSAAWIVNKLARESVYNGLHANDSDVAYLKSRTRYRYDNQCQFSLGAQPTRGVLTAVDRWNGLTGVDTCGNNPINPAFVITGYGYDQWGNQTVITDALNYTTTTVYDDQYHLYPTQVINAKNQSTRYSFDRAKGLLTSVTDPNGATTSYGYDAFGRLHQIWRPGANPAYASEEYHYYDGGDEPLFSPFLIGHYVRGADAAWCSGGFGSWERLYYDGLGRLVERHSPLSGWTCSSGQIALEYTLYNAQGQVAEQSVPYAVNDTAGSGTYYQNPDRSQPNTKTTYDAMGRASQVTTPDSTITRSYYKGWQTAVVDANNHQKISSADAFGRLVTVQEYAGTYPNGVNWNDTVSATTRYAYDALNNLTDVWDAANNNTHMVYDQLSRKTSMSDPDMGQWYYTYDTRGNLQTQMDARNQTLWFKYDELNRLTEKRLTNSTGTLLASYGYDAYDGVTQFGRGHRTTMSVTNVDTTSWMYGLRGRVTQESKSIVGAGTFNTSYAYDAMDRVTSMIYPNGEVVTQAYNNAVQLTQVRSATYGVNYAVTSRIVWRCKAGLNGGPPT